MAWQVEVQNDVKGLLKASVDLISLKERNGFRGQGREAWQLQPSIDRGIPPDISYKKRLDAETDLVKKFREQTTRFFEPIETAYLRNTLDSVTTESLAVLQHYGAPTRLLDWSYSPFVALYFAAIHHPNEDGAVWWFNRIALDHVAHSRWSTYECTREQDGTINLNAHAFTVNSSDWFCGTDYPFKFSRLRKQHGFFSMTGRLGVDHGERIAEMLTLKSNPTKWIIPAASKPELLDHLNVMNINAASIGYEGADHVGHRLAQEFQAKCDGKG